MFVDTIRHAIEASPRMKLPEVAALLWRAFGAGQVTEAEAEMLSGLIEVRQALPAPVLPTRRKTGSRPRSSASLERRRQWSTSGRLPPSLSAKFTPAEVAVLSVLAVEVKRTGDCRWPHARLAAVAGVSESSVKRALRAARDLGLIQIEERKVSAFRNDTNVVEITSPEWRGWLRLGGGGQVRSGTNKMIYEASYKIAGKGLQDHWGAHAARSPESSEMVPQARFSRRRTHAPQIRSRPL